MLSSQSLLKRSRAVCIIALLAAAPARAQIVRVVNLIPPEVSGEADFNSEPHIAVNPRNVKQIVTSVQWTHDLFCDPNDLHSAVLVSDDEGATWSKPCKLVNNPKSWPRDITLAFSGDGKRLYGGYLLWDSTLNVWSGQFAVTDHFSSSDEMKIVFTKPDVDQPHLHAWAKAGKRYLLVAVDDNTMYTSGGPNPCAAGVVYYTPDIETSAALGVYCVSRRPSAGRTPALRVASHSGSGVAYAVFYRPLRDNYPLADVVVVRGKATSANLLGVLFDSPASGAGCSGSDGALGRRVATCRAVPKFSGVDPNFGQERRVRSALGIAVDPRNEKRVFVAWGDSVENTHQTLHIRRSKNSGKNWSNDLFTVPNATNPALAVDKDGTVGFLFQQLLGSGSSSRWRTVLVTSDNEFATRKEFELANAPAMDPPCTGICVPPYLGDYLQLTAVGRTFYGVFSTSNDPSKVVFPFGVTFQRNVVGGVLQDASGAAVAPSIDPYFFSVKKLTPP